MSSFILFVVFFSLPDPAAELLARDLGNDSWLRRERTSAALVRLGERARPSLRHALHSPDLEVRRRAFIALEALNVKRVEDGLKLLGEPLPYLDMVYWTDGNGYSGWRTNAPFLYDLAQPYIHRRIKDHEPISELWWEWRLATKDLVIDLLQAGIPAWTLRPMVEEMRRREVRYLAFMRGR